MWWFETRRDLRSTGHIVWGRSYDIAIMRRPPTSQHHSCSLHSLVKCPAGNPDRTGTRYHPENLTLLPIHIPLKATRPQAHSTYWTLLTANPWPLNSSIHLPALKSQILTFRSFPPVAIVLPSYLFQSQLNTSSSPALIVRIGWTEVRVSNIFNNPSAATVEIKVGVCGEKVALYICEEWAGIVISDVARDVDHYSSARHHTTLISESWELAILTEWSHEAETNWSLMILFQSTEWTSAECSCHTCVGRP